jgi:GNAT superfamily N-acetyltransferase
MEHSEEKGSHTTVIRRFAESDIPVMVVRFAEHHWSKPAEIFEEYLREQKAGDRVVWIASVDNEFAGYITLAWRSQYQPFRDRQIPEVMDLNVLPPFRRGGVGLKLLVTAESEAATRGDVVGIGVGLYGGDDGGYGAAQRLYVAHGYIPDGRGVTYNYRHVVPDSNVQCDDDLVLWFTRQLKRSS